MHKITVPVLVTTVHDIKCDDMTRLVTQALNRSPWTWSLRLMTPRGRS